MYLSDFWARGVLFETWLKKPYDTYKIKVTTCCYLDNSKISINLKFTPLHLNFFSFSTDITHTHTHTQKKNTAQAFVTTSDSSVWDYQELTLSLLIIQICTIGLMHTYPQIRSAGIAISPGCPVVALFWQKATWPTFWCLNHQFWLKFCSCMVFYRKRTYNEATEEEDLPLFLIFYDILSENRHVASLRFWRDWKLVAWPWKVIWSGNRYFTKEYLEMPPFWLCAKLRSSLEMISCFLSACTYERGL